MGRELDSVHKRRIQGGDSHRERQRRRVECSECGLSLSAGSRAAHMRTRHGIYTTGERQDAEPPHRVMPHTWDVHFPKGGGTRCKALVHQQYYAYYYSMHNII